MRSIIFFPVNNHEYFLTCSSSYCLWEFDMAYHHNLAYKRKNNRLLVLMMLDNPNDLCAINENDTVTVRQYVRQYTYIDYKAGDWLDKLVYALPLHGLLEQGVNADSADTDANADANATADNVELLKTSTSPQSNFHPCEDSITCDTPI